MEICTLSMKTVLGSSPRPGRQPGDSCMGIRLRIPISPKCFRKYGRNTMVRNSFRAFPPRGFFTFNVIDPLNQYMAENNPDLNGISHENWILISYIPMPLLFSEAALVVFFTTIFGTFILFLSFRQVAENRRHESLAYQAPTSDSEKKLDIISESSQDAIILTDQNDLIEYWNKSAERLFGYSADEVLGKGIHIDHSKTYGWCRD